MELIEETRKICVQERTKSILFLDFKRSFLTYGIGALTLFEQYLSFLSRFYPYQPKMKVY